MRRAEGQCDLVGVQAPRGSSSHENRFVRIRVPSERPAGRRGFISRVSRSGGGVEVTIFGDNASGGRGAGGGGGGADGLADLDD